MFTFQSLLDNIQKLIDSLESMIRGGLSRTNIDGNIIYSISMELFQWISSTEAVELSKTLSPSQRKDLSSLAVKLNTKARALTSASSDMTAKLRSIAKSISAWIVFQFHDPTVKALQIVISLLASTMNEFDQVEMRLICAKGVSKAWDIINQLAVISSQLSIVQLHDLKVNVIEAWLEEVRITIKLKLDDTFSSSIKNIQKCIEVCQSLEYNYSIHLAEKILEMASSIASSVMMLEEAKHFYLLCVNILQSIRSREHDIKSDILYHVDLMKSKALLALAYIYMENGECDRAISYVQSVEDITGLPENMEITINYAKFSIYAKDGDWSLTESSFKTLMKLSIGFDMAMDILKSLIALYVTKQECQHGISDRLRSYFTTLFNKFPSDNEITTLRVTEVQSFVLCIDNLSPDTDSLERNQLLSNLMEILNSIIDDHKNQVKSLDHGHYETLKNILIGRIKVYRSIHNWSMMFKWCDIATSFFVRDPIDINSVLLYKIDALLNLDRFNEAFQLASNLVERDHSTVAIFIAFKAALYALPPTKAVSFLLTLLNGNMNEFLSVPSDLFVRILQCCSIIKESSKISSLHKNISLSLLLKSWIDQFIAIKGWKYDIHMDRNDQLVSDEDNVDITYFKVGLFYLQTFMAVILEVTNNSLDDSIDRNDNNHNPTVSLNVVENKGNENTETKLDKQDKEEEKNVIMNDTNIVQSSIQQLIHFKQEDDEYSLHHEDKKLVIGCSLSLLKVYILNPFMNLPSIIQSIKTDGGTVDHLGTEADMENIANILWHFGCFLTRTDNYEIVSKKEIIESFIEKDLSCPDFSDDSYHRYQLAALFFEASESIFDILSTGDRNAITANQIMCLILSSASRLDSELIFHDRNINKKNPKDSFDFHSVDHSESFPISSLPENLSFARKNILRTQSLIRKLSGFENPILLKQFRSLALIMEFSILCKSYPRLHPTIIEKFIESSLSMFLDLTCQELIRCAEIASEEPSGTAEISRQMYSIALQVSIRDENDKALIGNLYSKIIDLSPSRHAKIETIKEFIQILQSEEINDDDDGSFDRMDIDRICSQAYNSGVTLASLEQYSLASDVITLALQILRYSSQSFRHEWQSRIQDVYADIITKQTKKNLPFLLENERNESSDHNTFFLMSENSRKETYLTNETFQP